MRARKGGDFPVRELQPDRFTVLVMGGSQGAQRINRIVPDALCRMHATGRPLQVIHLTGKGEEHGVLSRYLKAGVPHVVMGYLDDMPAAYAAADVAISRAGAASCHELAVHGVPTLFVPLPTARRNHQYWNARELAKVGGARVLEQSQLTIDGVSNFVDYILSRDRQRKAMSKALRAWAVADAAEQVADLVLHYAEAGKR